MANLTSDERAQLNARIGTLQALQDAASMIGNQFVRRHKESGQPAEVIAQTNALVNMINNDLKVQERNLQALLPTES